MRNLITLLISAATVVYGYPNPMPCTGTCTNAHDPSLIRRDDGLFYRFSTGNRIAVHTAKSITGPWIPKKQAAIPNGSKIQLAGNQDLWVSAGAPPVDVESYVDKIVQAPDVRKIGDKYYLYYAVSTPGSRNSAIGVATSTNLDTWTDHGATGISSTTRDNYNAIDGALHWDGTNFVMTFGSFWDNIFVIKMQYPPTRVMSGTTKVQIAHKPAGDHAQEAPFLVRIGDYHYLFFSAGNCCGYDKKIPEAGEEYKIQVCRSKTSTRNFVDMQGTPCTQGGGTTVLKSHGYVYGPGGQGVFVDSGNSYLYYHYVDTRSGYGDGDKKFGINAIDWSSGWPVLV
ncbi:hypothetical protein ACEQ8H_008727 [Pleosporales sp. CAS-2024a]